MIEALLNFIWRIIVVLVSACIIIPACAIGVAFVVLMIPVGLLLLPFIILGAEVVKHINKKEEKEE